MGIPGGTGGGPSALAPGSRFAGYTLEEEIGAGGMAVVFRARDERLDRLVALKLLAPGLAADEEFRRRFLREARAAAAVEDPHIIPVHEAGEAGGVLFIAMRLVSGGDVQGLLRREGPLPPGRVAAIVSPVASALDAAHGAGLVHRDVKPANMLIDARPGRPDHVYLSDFGLAKGGSASALTGTGLYLGTVAYMAPEQIQGGVVDGRADQYALGCAAFELLCGGVPFERDEDVAVIYAHLSAPPPSLVSRRPDVPPAVDAVLGRALAKAPQDRYASCGEFAEALRGAFGLAGYDSDPGAALVGVGDVTMIPPAAGGGDRHARDLPAGTVTMLFTDIEGSTALLSRLGKHYGAALSAQRVMMRAAIAACGGREMGTEGDGFFVVFSSAGDAVRCCVEAQRALARYDWPGDAAVRVRMGLHSGEPARHEDGYIGLDVHRAARIAAAAYGGQVVLSEAAWRLAGPGAPDGIGVRDLGFHRLKDIAEPEHVYQLTGPGLAEEFPPLKSLGAPTRLPVPPTPLVDREADLGYLLAELADPGVRLVTLTGPGGVGKTRLAIEAARQVTGRFADGVCLVELAAVQEPALVSAAAASVLGIPQASGLSTAESLTAALTRQQVLLVLDNCEHIIGPAADLCEMLLQAADDVRILATSREPLRVAGEARYRLAPLSVPQSDGQAEAGQSAAVQLFADRAQRVDPRFSLDPESGPMVARLVTGLDGMPLAIELAAARVEVLGLKQLVDRLDDRFALLAGGDRRAAARQQSLAATVDWSYQLLSEPEQRFFRQLSVFPGPFTLEAARAVAGPAAEPALLHLVDCSLISPPRPGPDGRVRYAMLETLRAYALGRLSLTGEQPTVALTAFMLGVAEAAAAELETSNGELAAGRWLDAEDRTMHQALTWALEHDRDAALRLAVALAPWWVLRGRYAAGHELLTAAAAPVAVGDPEWCAAQFWLGRLTRTRTVGLDHFTAVRDALTGRGASRLLVDALSERAVCLMNLDRVPEAADEARRALELARELAYPAGEARALHVLGGAAGYAGDHQASLAWLQQTQQIDPASLPGPLVRRCLIGLAIGLAEVVQPADAQQQCIRGLALAREAGDLRDQADCLQLMTRLALQAGRLSAAMAYLHEGVEITVRMGGDFMLVDYLDLCGHVCARSQRYADALTAWAAQAALLEVSDLLDVPEEAERRQDPLREARQMLGADPARAAEDRGAAMGLATAAEYMLLLSSPPAQAPGSTDLPQLSARERELVVLVAQGRSNAQIAGQLHLSVSTVRHRLDRIRSKAGCPRRADLVRFALQAGVV